MDAAVREAIERFGRIDGVLHAAGLPGQGLTQLKTAQTAAAVMAPKIQGTLALDRALEGLRSGLHGPDVLDCGIYRRRAGPDRLLRGERLPRAFAHHRHAATA